MAKKKTTRDELITEAEFGRLIDRTRGRISQLLKAGILTRDRSGKLWRDANLERYAKYVAGSGSQPGAPGGGSAEGIFRELAAARLEFARLKIRNQELANRIAEMRAEIQHGRYVLIDTLKRSTAFDFAPTHAAIRSLAARIVWALAPSHERAVELQRLFENGLRLAYLQQAMRDLASEKAEMTTAAETVLISCRDQGARALARRILDIYARIEPDLARSLRVHIIGAVGDLAADQDPVHLARILDGVLMISRDHTRQPAPIVLSTQTGDRITLMVPDEDTAQMLIFGLIGAPEYSHYRSSVVAEIEIAAVRFESRISDPIPPHSGQREEMRGGKK